MSDARRYVVYGAGAIGSGIGGHLFRTGHEVVLVARPAHVNKIKADGLQLVTPVETYSLRVPAVANAEEVGFRKGDVVLLCVKSQDTDESLLEIRAAAGPGSEVARELPILCCQNSITNEPAALRYFRRVYGVLVTVPGVFLEPGVVHNPIKGNAGVLEVGLFPTGIDALAEKAATAFSKATYVSFANPRVMEAKGAKMLGNLGNAMGAITDGKGAKEVSQAFMKAVRDEAIACFEKAGVPFESQESFGKRMQGARGETALPPGLRNLGSTWQSLMRGRNEVEADYLNGEVVRLGRVNGVPTPHNAVLQDVANLMASRGETPGRYTADDLAQIVTERG
jgi:2-dehydropantoate 2-reductase